MPDLAFGFKLKGGFVCATASEKVVVAAALGVHKVKIEVVVSSEDWADLTEKAIRKAAYTGDYGDGKIFTYEVRSAQKIRTGETGYDAIQRQE